MIESESDYFLYCPYCGVGQAIEDIEMNPGNYQMICHKCFEVFDYEVRISFCTAQKDENA